MGFDLTYQLSEMIILSAMEFIRSRYLLMFKLYFLKTNFTLGCKTYINIKVCNVNKDAMFSRRKCALDCGLSQIWGSYVK